MQNSAFHRSAHQFTKKCQIFVGTVWARSISNPLKVEASGLAECLNRLGGGGE